MNLSEKLNKVIERFNSKVEAIQVTYYDKMNEDATLYYFYYNQNNDPTIVSCPVGEKPSVDSIAVSLPSSVHQDLDFRSRSSITETQLESVIKNYKILTENVLRKNVENGKVIRKRVTTIEKPNRIKPLVNKIKSKKAGLYAQTAIARVKRNRSNNIRDILNLDKQVNKNKSVLENKETIMNRNDFNHRPNRLNETYMTYPQARSIADDIVNTLYTKKLASYNIKYPQTGTCIVDQKGFSIDFGMTNRKYMAKEQLLDYIAKDILGRCSRGEELPEEVAKSITLHKV